MYLILKKGLLRRLVQYGFRKSGNIRKLSKKTGISRSTLSEYHNEKRAIKKENLEKLEEFLKEKINKKNIVKELPDNWKQVLGGINSVKSKIKNGTFEKQLKKAQLKSSKRMKRWHKLMKKNNPEEYHLIQYSRFKKIGGYKHKTKKGELVRNILEKQTADILNKMNIEYKYEPLVNIGKRYFFPDFLVDNKIIIECTMWKGETKAYKLKEKIKYLKKKYKVFVLVPKHLNKYYKILNSHLINELDDYVPVAQSFIHNKK